MSAVGSEVGALPVTGSGPFTFVIGVIGVVAIAVGSIMRRVSKRDDVITSNGYTSAPGKPDISSDLTSTIAAPGIGRR
jgi:hypothetical protein